MAIVDYGKRAEEAQRRIFEDGNISETNKKYIKRFLLIYDVTDARKGIFFQKVYGFLRQFPDIQQVTRDEVNEWYFDLKEKYSPATVATYTNVIGRLMRWLNDGQLPNAFLDTKATLKASKRDLDENDMVSWEEGLMFSRLSPSIQLQSALLSQLDAGFRPGEFIIPLYKDIKIINSYCVWHVTDGKTGSRHVVLYRATPFLKLWLESHPTKSPDDPLWINEAHYARTKEVVAYEYPALAKRIKRLGKICGFSKPLDCYNLRHSSCTLDKKDNIPVDLAAERHGHSVEHYVETYGRISVDEMVTRFSDFFKKQAPQAHRLMEQKPEIMSPLHQNVTENTQRAIIEHQLKQLQQQLENLSPS